MQTTWTNNRVALAKDLVFGLCVFGETADGALQWIPVDTLDLDEVELVHKLVDWNPSCIYQDELNRILESKKKEKAA